MNKMVLGMFEVQENAGIAIKKLHEAGFHHKNISIMTKDPRQAKELTDDEKTSGAGIGAVFGGLAGMAIAATPVLFPVLGVVAFAGPAAVLAGGLLGGATGGLVGALIDFGIPDEHAKEYEKGIARGGTLLGVPVTETNEELAEDILEANGATGIKIVESDKINDAVEKHQSTQVAA